MMSVVLASGTSAVAVDVDVVVDEDEEEAADVVADEETAMLLATSAPTLASTATRRATGHVNVPSRAVKMQSVAVEAETVLAAAVATVVEAVVAEIRLGSVVGTKEGMRRALSMPCDEDGAMFLAHGFISLEQSTPAYSYTAQHVELSEPRACAYLGVDEEEVDNGWYLDSGATHHMTGRQEFFVE
jgi:hypothetical protein